MWDRARALAMRKKNDRLVGHRHTYDEMGEMGTRSAHGHLKPSTNLTMPPRHTRSALRAPAHVRSLLCQRCSPLIWIRTTSLCLTHFLSTSSQREGSPLGRQGCR